MTVNRAAFGSHSTALFLVAGSTGVSIVLGAVRLKLVALSAGATGLGGVAMVLAIGSATAAISSLGIAGSAAARLSAAVHELSREPVLDAVRLGTLMATPVSAILAIVAWVLAGPSLVGVTRPLALTVVGLTAASIVIAANCTAVLAGYRKFGRLAVAQVSSGILATVLVAAATKANGFPLLLTATALPSLLLLIATWTAISPTRPRLQPRRRRRVLLEGRRLATLGMVLGVPPLVLNATQFLSSALLSSRSGLADAGYFQGAWAITSGMLTVCLAALNAVHLPRLMAARGRPELLRQMIRTEAMRVGAAAGSASLGIALFGSHVLALLYAKDFANYADTLILFLVGGTLKACGWAISYLLPAEGRYSAFFSTELVWCLVLTCALLWDSEANAGSAGLAYASASGAGLLASLILTRLRVRPHMTHLRSGQAQA